LTDTIIPGEVAWIISGLNFVTSEYILGLKANESGTFWYNGHGKLKRRRLGNQKVDVKWRQFPEIKF
jgi:hypothetical protein